MGTHDTNLNFLRSRIYEIRSALFSHVISNYYRFPTCIVAVLKVDEYGGIWFLMNSTGCHLYNESTHFPARLCFYRRGHSFSLNISGEATVVMDPAFTSSVTGIPEKEQKTKISGVMLVKVKILNAEYSEWSLLPAKHFFRNVWTIFWGWLHPVYSPVRRPAEYSVS